MASCSSLGYADMLKPRDVEELGGGLGIPEREDEESVLREKCDTLVEMIREANGIGADVCACAGAVKREDEKKKEEEDNANRRRHGVVVFTGAGISTACGIPDFRGPNGVWTAKAEGRPPPTGTTPFGAARPTFTHMALCALMSAGYVKFIVSQNVDGLHARSGLRRKVHLAEIHGNAFVEKCETCGVEYIRDFPVETLGFRCTPRRCGAIVRGNDDEKADVTCGGRLRDMNLDWESPLPDDEYDMSVDHTKSAKLCLCIGTSLRITPICLVPQKAEKMAIVNLQPIPKDKKAALVVRGKCDAVMRNVVTALGLRLPVWRRWDGLRCQYTLRANPKRTSDGSSRRVLALEIRVGGHGGDGCLAPWLDTVIARFPSGRSMPKGGVLKFLRSKSTFVLRRTIDATTCLPLSVVLEMRVNDAYFSDPARDIMRSAPTTTQLDELGLSGSSLVDGHLIRTVSMNIESMPNEASITTQYLGDEYHPK